MQSLLRALETPRRREILRLLRDRERPAGEIHAELGDVTFGAVSQHLRVLERAGLVAVRREGRRRIYRARPAALGPFRAWLEASWDDALYRLKLAAELEAARRGPRPRAPGRRATQNRRSAAPARRATPSARRDTPRGAVRPRRSTR